ncbi:UPF0262 family protein [Rhizobium mesoamericanum]|nr:MULTISPECIES: UPF0262 family protein [Rhizobium]
MSLAPFRRMIKDYTRIWDSYYEATCRHGLERLVIIDKDTAANAGNQLLRIPELYCSPLNRLTEKVAPIRKCQLDCRRLKRRIPCPSTLSRTTFLMLLPLTAITFGIT